MLLWIVMTSKEIPRSTVVFVGEFFDALRMTIDCSLHFVDHMAETSVSVEHD